MSAIAAEKRTDRGRLSRSLPIGLAILECFSSKTQLLGIADLADAFGWSRSTTHRYVITLVALGFLEQPSNSARKYRLGSRVHGFGMAAVNSRYLRPAARPYLEELRSRVSYTVSLGLLDGSEVVMLDRLPGYRGHHRLGLEIGIGSRMPSHCTSMGKVLLAHLPGDTLRRMVDDLILEEYGPNTITTKRALLRELDQIRTAGFAVDEEELARGARSIAAPVQSRTGKVAGAASIEVPTVMVPRLKMVEDFGPQLLGSTELIAKDLEDEPPFKVKKQCEPKL